jgi:2'-5' RNA ligase
VRLFLAINPTPDVHARIAEATSPLREAAPGLRWVAPDRVHLTVRFLGEQPEGRVAELSDAIDAVVTRHADAPLVLEGVGAFPNFRRARVLWVGAQPHPRLELLHHDVEEACASLGFEPEGRPFRPHLTIARVPDGTPEDTLRSVSRAARAVRLDAGMHVASVDLMASELAPGGPRYRLLHASPLRTAA